MKRRHFRFWAASASAAVLSAAGTAAHAQNAAITDASGAGKLVLEERLRYEGVEQAPFARDAQALTLRTHLGWETGAWENVKAAVEFEDVRHIGAVHYNTTINGKTLTVQSDTIAVVGAKANGRNFSMRCDTLAVPAFLDSEAYRRMTG